MEKTAPKIEGLPEVARLISDGELGEASLLATKMSEILCMGHVMIGVFSLGYQEVALSIASLGDEREGPDARSIKKVAALVKARQTKRALAYLLGCDTFVRDLIIESVLGGEVYRWSEPWSLPVGGQGWQSVAAAITAVTECSTLTEVLKRCVAFTGDVDTVAAIAMAAASHAPEVRNDLDEHPHLLAGLENGAYGRDYLEDLDRKLLALSV